MADLLSNIASRAPITHSFANPTINTPAAADTVPNVAPTNGPTGFWSRIGHVGVSLASALTSGEQTVAKGVVAAGGGADELQAQQKAQAQGDLSNQQQIQTLKNQGKLKFGKLAKNSSAIAQEGSSLPSQVAQSTKDTEAATNKRKFIAGAYESGLQPFLLSDAGLTGVGEVFKAGEGVNAVRTGELATKVPDALKIGSSAATLAAQGAASGAISAAGADKLSAKELAKQAAIGAAIPVAGHLLSSAVGKVAGKLSGKAATAGAQDIGTVLDENALKDIGKGDKIPVIDKSTGTTTGEVSKNSFPAKTDIKPTASNVPYTDAQFRQEFKANSGAASRASNTANSYLKTGSKDSLTLTVQNLADSTNSKTVGSIVDKLLPDISTEDRNGLVKGVVAAKNTNDVKQLLFDAAQNAKHDVTAISPEQKVTFAGLSDGQHAFLTNRVGEIDKTLQSVSKGTQVLPADQLRTMIKEKIAIGHIASGDIPYDTVYTKGKSATEKLTGKGDAVQVANADATHGDVASLEQPVSRPKSETVAKEPTVLENNNKTVKQGLLQRILPDSLKGDVNPAIALGRAGHTEAQKLVENTANLHSKAIADTHDFMTAVAEHLKSSGQSADEFLNAIDKQATDGNKVAQRWVDEYKNTGSELAKRDLIQGAKDGSYIPRRILDDGKPTANMGTGLKQKGAFSKSRISVDTVDQFGNPTKEDKFKTFSDFKNHVESLGGKVNNDPVSLASGLGERKIAIANHDFIETAQKTAMADGKPMIMSYDTSKGVPKGYVAVAGRGLEGKVVHEDAVKAVKTLVGSSTLDNKYIQGLNSLSSKVKMLTTANPAIHGKNIATGSIREQGLINTAKALATDLKNPEIVKETQTLIEKGGLVPSTASRVNLYDQLSSGETGVMRNNPITKALGAIKSKSDQLLFHDFGDRLGIHAAINAKKAAMAAGISEEEANKIGGRIGNAVMGTSGKAEFNKTFQDAARLATFSSQWTRNTLRIATRATGIAGDRSMSEAAQKFEQVHAIKAVARGMAYLFAAANAINYATTGHSTLQNKDSKISPVFYVDKATGKEYHVTNFYGQLGDLLHVGSGDVKTAVNKASPGLQQIARIISNHDSFKGTPVYNNNAGGLHKLGQVLANTAENFITPAGFDISMNNRAFGKGGDPGVVSATKLLLGYGSSTKDLNPIERAINQKYLEGLPQAAPTKGSGPVKPPKTPQEQFDSLSSDNKLKIVQRYSKDDLNKAGLNADSLARVLSGSSAKTSIQSLNDKGYSNDQIQKILQNAGYNKGQLIQVQRDAKAKLKFNAAANKGKAKFVNPFLK